MKYMLEYEIRTAGLTHEQGMAGQQALLTAFSKWRPDDGLKVHAFLGKVAGAGGYVLVEADDVKLVAAFVAKFTYWNDIEVVPVLDVGDSVANAQAALVWAQAAAKA